MASLPNALAAANQHAKAESSGQSDMFGLLTTEPEQVQQAFVEVPPWPEKVWLDGEKVTLGLYLTGHPINQYLAEIKHYAPCRLVDLKPTNRDQISYAVGLVLGVRIMTNKRGRRWALVTLDDKSARVDVRFFPDMLEQFEELLQEDKILVISGQVSFDEFSGGNTMSGRDVMDLVQAREKNAKWLQVQLESSWCNPSTIAKLEIILQPYQGGSCPVQVNYTHPDVKVDLTLGAQWYVTPQDELLYDLQQLLGKPKVNLEFH
jgi:DNA polymerase-3 subunit alpha